ncbi:MAG: DUF3488 domain-containing transglutaminase family protein [Aquificae bacterium]|nr:DUF3488 domain-containing transglutaminase family protein [Aquificota bacterium]
MEGRGPSLGKLALTISYLLVVLELAGLYGVASLSVYAFVLFALGLGALSDAGFTPHPPRPFLNVLALGGVLLFLSSLSLENIVTPLSETLLFLTGVKLLEEKKLRDMYQILLLSFLGVSLGVAVSLDIPRALLFLLVVILGILQLILLDFYKNLGNTPLEGRVFKRLILTALGISVGAFGLSWVFFVLLPRVEKPLFDLFGGTDKKLLTGITEEVELGKVGEIHMDNRVVMRVFGIRFESQPYWRVSVLDTYDGKVWRRTLKFPEPERNPAGKPYTIILEPTFERFLPLLDYPSGVLRVEGFSGKVRRFKGGFYEFDKPLTKPVRIRALHTDTPPSDEPLPIYLSLPDRIPERVKQLAKKLSEGAKSPQEKIRRVEEFFRREGFRYSLSLKHEGGDPLEEFLFERKEGNCEYFASATAVLLRLTGVPARLVSGFHGALLNDYGDYYIVLNAMAHVWVEAYDGRAWKRVDTTPPYTPPALEKLSGLAFLYDAILTFWYENVVGFDTQKQRSVIRAGARLLASLKENSAVLSLLLGVVGLLALGVFLYERELRKTPDNLYRKLLSRLKKYGVSEKLPERVLDEVKGKPIYEEVKFIIRAYQRYKYSKVRDKEELRDAYRLLKKI